MIKTLIARTAEVDDKKLAVEQIVSQLGSAFMKNTVGIVTCHYEFVFSGIFKALSEALPFDIVGTVSTSQSAAGETDTMLLTIMVLTSDDVEFAKTVTPSLAKEPGKVIAESYRTATAALTKKPALIFAFAPFMLQNSGDEYVNVISQVSGGVPCFGTIAVDDTLDFANSFMLADGEAHRDKMVMLLFRGKIEPKFYVANISESKMIKKSAVVTKSAGPVLMEVNERPIMDYFEDLGLVKASETQYALTSLPFLLDYNDGTPKVAKIFVMLTPEKYALCAGAMPEGSTLYIAASDKDDIMLTTSETLDKLLKDIDNASGLLIYSCIGRSITLGSEQFLEMELVKQKIGASLPYMMASSGGEICPTQVSDNKAINRFHNSTFVACLF